MGTIWGGVADALALQGGSATARVLSGASWATREATLQTDYAASVSKLKLLSGDNGFGGNATPLNQIVNSWESSFTQFFSSLQAISQNTLIYMADADAGGLVPRTLPAALTYLIAQMAANSTTVNSTTVSVGSQTNVGTPTGTPIIVLSSLNGQGKTLQYANSETLTFACSSDAQTGGATSGQETLTVTGQAAVTSPWASTWPGGSGLSTTMNACASYNAVAGTAVNNSGASLNVLQNSAFTTFTTANAPDNWVVGTGTVGTQVVSGGSGNAYNSSGSVGFVGDSSTLTAITQQFNTTPSTTLASGGTLYQPAPQTPFAVTGWVKLSSASPVAGVLEIALVDGSGAIINDANGTANSTTVALTGLADTLQHNWNAVFRLPALRPSTVKLRIRLSTALTTGTTAYLSNVAMNPMKQLYPSGPFASVFSGVTPMILGDAWTLAYTPTWGVVQQYCERFFGMKALGLQIPNKTSSPTVADSIVA